ncbi:hypothetical protein M0804_007462, partial [Polistes exclamans]
FYQLFTSEVTLESAVAVLQKVVGTVGLIAVFCTTYFNFVTMKLLLTHMKSYYEQVVNEKELSMLKETVKQSKICIYGFIGIFNSYGIILIIPCVVKVCLYFLGILNDNKLSLILPVNNVTKAGAQYFGLLIYQIIAVLIVITIGALSFSGYLLGVLFACYQFRVLMYVLSYQTYEYNTFSRYVDLLNNFSRITYLVIVFIAVSVIVFDFLYIFQLSIDLQNAVEIIGCSAYIAGSMLTLYINFYFGQELMNYSDLVFEELRQVPIYILSNKTQKILLFMIARSCKQSVLSIGGMFVSSHETFAVFAMASGGSRIFNEHFFFSNKFVQSILGFRPGHSQKEQLFLLCAVTFYVFPGVVHQMKLLFSHMKSYYEQVVNEKELSMLEETIKQSKICVYVFLGVFNSYGILMIIPCVVKVCLYFLGILNDNKLSLILPVNNVSNAGAQFFGLLIYQIIAVLIIITIGALSFSGHLLCVLFACYQFRVLIFIIQCPFERNLIYMEKNIFFNKSQEEWDWIIDIINRYKNITE